MKRMRQAVQILTAAAMVALFGLAGCGGGSGGGGTTTTSVSGVVADGYLVGAKVCLDTNNNRACDANEPTATTTAGGAYTLTQVQPADLAAYPVLVEVAVGVVDEDRGPVTQAYVLSAPAGRYQFVSPLTTLVQRHGEANNLSAADAEVALRNQLGLGVNLFENYQPGVAAATAGQKLAAAVAARVATAMATAQAAVEAANPGWSASERFNAVIAQVMGQLAAIVQQAQQDVAPPVVNFTVTPSAGSGGAIAPNTAQTVNQGGTASFSVTPATGYAIGSVSGCGGSLSGNTYTTGAITGDCTVAATFQQTQVNPPPVTSYTVTPSAGSGGAIAPSTVQTVNQGGTTSFSVTPATGYAIGSVSGCGGSLSGNTYTTGAITGNCTVAATFTALSYTVTPSAGDNGSISPATVQSVNHGTATSFNVTPATGYAIGSVSGCGGSLSGNTYTTGAITTNCTVSATFASTTGSATFGW